MCIHCERSVRRAGQGVSASCRRRCRLPSLRVPQQRIERVALACGAAAGFLADAVACKADAFLTGEARFHDVLAAQAQGIALVLAGHYASERCGVENLAACLQKQFPSLEIWASRRERDPLAAV